jgi:hypothetical protein
VSVLLRQRHGFEGFRVNPRRLGLGHVVLSQGYRTANIPDQGPGRGAVRFFTSRQLRSCGLGASLLAASETAFELSSA